LPLRYGKRAFINRGFAATGGWQAPPIGPWLEEFAGGGDIPEGV
jgi:3'(2'), 5'-bisphosphate nucleotidase